MEDIDIICKQTGRSREDVMDIYQKNNHDIVNTICDIENFKSEPKKESKVFSHADYKVIPDSDTLSKLEELRKIVDQKDALLETLKDKTN